MSDREDKKNKKDFFTDENWIEKRISLYQEEARNSKDENIRKQYQTWLLNAMT